MDNGSNVVVKQSKGLIVVVILLVLALIGLSTYVVYDSKNANKYIKEEEKTTSQNKKVDDLEKNESNKTDTKKVLSEVSDVYKEAYNVINSHEEYTKYDENELSPYFTKKSLNIIEKMVTNSSNTNPAFFSGLFGRTNQSIRPLTILYATDDTVFATGQTIDNSQGDKDEYPLYIVFKNDNGTWKIDLFE